MPYSNVIFDLDGTLIDSIRGIEASARYAVDRQAEPRALPPLGAVIGPPVDQMFAQLWPDALPAELERLVHDFRQHYDAQGCLLSQLYPGVSETLKELGGKRIKMFVLTNKPSVASRTILKELGVLDRFTDVLSPDSRQPSFSNKMQGAESLQAKYQLEGLSTLLLGDGLDDFEAASACGFEFAVAAYGYGSAATQPEKTSYTHVVKKFHHLESIVL